MKKTLAALTTAILAIGITLTGVTTANADTTADASTPSTSTTATSTTTVAPDSAAVVADSSTAPSPSPSATTVTAPVTKTATVTKSAPNPYSTTTPTSPYTPAPTCVSNPVFTYTYNGTDAGTITAAKYGSPTGSTLCKPLYVRATTWTYDTPINSTNAGWPQTLKGFNDVTVTSLGTVSYQAPVVATCKQNDIYASFTGYDDLALPTNLTGPNAPHEPAFLHAVLPGAGPTPTYYQSTTAGCDIVKPVATVTAGACMYDQSQNGSFESVTLNYDNSASNEPVSFAVQGYSSYNRTVPAGQVEHVSAQASWTGGVSYTVIAAGDIAHPFVLSVPAFADCGDIPVAYEGDPIATPQTCALDEGDAPVAGSITVFAAAHVSYLIHNTDSPSRVSDKTVLDGSTTLPVGHYLVTASADAGYRLTNTPPTTVLEITDLAVNCQLPSHAAYTPDASAVGQSCTNGGTVSGYIQITPGDGLTYFVGGTQLTSARTAEAPGTYIVTAVAGAGDTVLGTNPITLSVDRVGTSCGDPRTSDLKTLAFTGAEGTAGFLGVSAILLLIGAALIFATKKRRIREGE